MFQKFCTAFLGRKMERFPEYVNAACIYREGLFGSYYKSSGEILHEKTPARYCRGAIRLPPELCAFYSGEVGLDRLRSDMRGIIRVCVSPTRVLEACEEVSAWLHTECVELSFAPDHIYDPEYCGDFLARALQYSLPKAG